MKIFNLTSKDITVSTSADNIASGTITMNTSKMANNVYVGKE